MKKARHYLFALAFVAVCSLLVPGCVQQTKPKEKHVGPGAKEARQTPGERAEAEAMADLAQGKLILLGPPSSMPPEWHGHFVTLLKKKCGCDYDRTRTRVGDGRGGRKGLEAARFHAEWYNSVMIAELRRRFGKSILEDLQAEAEIHLKDKAKSGQK